MPEIIGESVSAAVQITRGWQFYWMSYRELVLVAIAVVLFAALALYVSTRNNRTVDYEQPG